MSAVVLFVQNYSFVPSFVESCTSTSARKRFSSSTHTQ